ncbi:MAG: hypothetical protein E6Q97_03250 [Desulfurellales bacterium]|nr:MAG: hypothetical protein E6Q97_03250 [Desulfurellales bacterium]
MSEEQLADEYVRKFPHSERAFAKAAFLYGFGLSADVNAKQSAEAFADKLGAIDEEFAKTVADVLAGHEASNGNR